MSPNDDTGQDSEASQSQGLLLSCEVLAFLQVSSPLPDNGAVARRIRMLYSAANSTAFLCCDSLTAVYIQKQQQTLENAY